RPDAAFTQRDQRLETMPICPWYWNFESISLQRRWGMAWMSEQAADRIGEPLPNRPLVGKRAGSALCQRVDAPLPSRLRRRPMAAEQASPLEPMERRVNRPLRQLEGAAAAALDLLDHRIAMRRPARQRGEHDHVEVPFEHFAFHRPERYRLATLGVKPPADPLQAAIDRGA